MLDIGSVYFHIGRPSLTAETSFILVVLAHGMFACKVDEYVYHFIDWDPTLFPIVVEYFRRASEDEAPYPIHLASWHSQDKTPVESHTDVLVDPQD